MLKVNIALQCSRCSPKGLRIRVSIKRCRQHSNNRTEILHLIVCHEDQMANNKVSDQARKFTRSTDWFFHFHWIFLLSCDILKNGSWHTIGTSECRQSLDCFIIYTENCHLYETKNLSASGFLKKNTNNFQFKCIENVRPATQYFAWLPKWKPI